MNPITFFRTVRAIEREAAAHGYNGDVFAADVPLVGTFAEQMAMAAIGCDTSPGTMSTRDRELHGRLVRAAVLTSATAASTATTTSTEAAKMVSEQLLQI